MLSTIDEVWKDIPGYENSYQVSSKGLVRSLDRYVNHKTSKKIFCKGKVLKQAIDEDGYCRINLRYKGKDKRFGVHRLVASTFIPNPDNLPQVNHIDGDKENNCVENLEWCTPLYNNRHAYLIGHRPKEMFDKIGEMHRTRITKPVKDVTTGEVYHSMISAERILNLYASAVSDSIKFNKYVKGHKFTRISKEQYLSECKNAVNY